MKQVVLLFGLTFSLLGGCALETLVDCRNLCDRYAECFDTSADVSECTTRCESRVEAGENDRADRCDSCLDDNALCASAVAACSAECGPLLAP